MAVWIALAVTAGLPKGMEGHAGFWSSHSAYLLIEPGGNVTYIQSGAPRDWHLTAPAHSFTSSGFSMGLLGVNRRFRIDQPPRERDGRWRMVVDGIDFERVDEVDPSLMRRRLKAFSRHGTPPLLPRIP